MGLGDVQYLLRQFGEIFGLKAEGTNRIPGMSIETRAKQHELRLDLVCRALESTGEGIVVVGTRDPVAQRNISSKAQSPARAGFLGVSGSWIKTLTIAVHAQIETVGIGIED